MDRSAGSISELADRRRATLRSPAALGSGAGIGAILEESLPKPTSPVLPEYRENGVVFAKNQLEYLPLPALRTAGGTVMSRWSLTIEEHAAIWMGADIFLLSMTYNQPLQPTAIEIGEERARSAFKEAAMRHLG
jgi:hypothetical protein